VTALAAILRHDGARCGMTELVPMLRAAGHHGPCRSIALDGNAGLGQLDRAGAAIAGEAGGRQVAFSGRLHEREELARLLDLPAGARSSDATLVLAAYERWGDDCVARLLGDFAFVVWDPERRRLVAGRDATGTRTLFYARAPGAWLVASEFGQLAAHPGAAFEPDGASLRRLLELDLADVGMTFWRGVRRLPPGHVLALDEAGPKVRLYWRPDPRAEIRLPDRAAYVERFRTLLAEAVRCRLEGPEPVGCLFSGGVDSSSVLCMAHAVRDRSGPPIKAFSMVFPAAPIDDRRYIEPVRDGCGAEVHYVPPPAMAPVNGLDAALRRMQGPFVDAHHHVLEALFSACVAGGCRVVLTGLRGDDVFGGLGYLADRLATLRLSGLRAELGAWSSVVGVSPRRLFWSLCVLPWLGWARPLGRFVRRPAIARSRLAPARAVPGGLARTEAIDLVVGPMTMLTTELFELNAASHGLVPAYPLWDRRIVEFLLAVPVEMRIGRGVTKRILREAMAGLAPEANMQRRDKLSLAPFFRRGLVQEDRERVMDALNDLHPVLARTVPSRRAARVLDDLLRGRDVPMLQLWFLICANLWLRQVAPEPAEGAGRHGR
jgi:asparagine synthase (glutamine-hydrolysing)